MLMQIQAKAQINPVLISENYSKGIVKILLFDPVLAQVDEETLGYLGRGSGFFVTDDGVIFTNRHVIEQCVYGYILYQDNYGELQIDTYSKGIENRSDVDCIIYGGYTIPIIQVYYGNGPNDYDLYLAEVLTYSDAYDGAVIKVVSDIDGNPVTAPFTALPLGNSDNVKIGEELVVMGYPAQYQGNYDLALKDMITFTKGYHSGLDYVFNEDYGFIKTDASINGGNSGGPVFGKNNTVIGIASAKGIQTNIGLVGGINGMYYVAAPESKIFTKLIAKGLTPPAKADNIAVKKGITIPMPNFAFCEDKLNKSSNMTTVTGIIKSADTGRPIKDAVVGLLIYDSAQDDFVVVSGGISNSKGEFTMEPDVELDVEYGIACMADGYDDLVDVISITKSTNYLTVTLAKSR
jgi:S1-C subfamily serine protease